MNLKNKGLYAGAAVVIAGLGLIFAEGNTSGGIMQVITGIGIMFASNSAPPAATK